MRPPYQIARNELLRTTIILTAALIFDEQLGMLTRPLKLVDSTYYCGLYEQMLSV